MGHDTPYPIPPSLRHEPADSPADSPANTPQYDAAGDITPYLGLRARLSQIWLNRWTVLLLLVLVRVVILIGGLRDDIGDAETQALAACTKVEDIGSAMASMPHYLSVGVNRLAADGISQAVQGLVALLEMILTGVEQLILFVVNFYIGTYVCLTSALVHGGLDVGIGAADEATRLMNDAIGTITTTLESDVSSVQDTINAAFSSIASASSIFGKTVTPPTLNLTGPVDDLRSIHVDDTSFVHTLQTLNATIPTYDQAENLTRAALAIPFDAVKTVLNNTYGSYAFDTSVFPVARKQPLTFCSDNTSIRDFFQHLYGLAATAKTAFVAVLAALAVLACVPATVLEVRRFRRQQRRARALAQQAYDPMDVVYITSRPFTAGAGLALASRCRSGGGPRPLWTRWAVAYATSLPALFVLSLAAAGFFSCACQAVLLAVVRREAPALTAEVSGFADDVVTSLEAVSTQWATDANGALASFQDDINRDLLGYVVNATAAANHTLHVFTDEIADGIHAVFNGTVLDNTVQQVVRCLVGIKIDAVEAGLTWVHDHAHLSLPRFPNDTFSAGAAASIGNDSSLTSFLADPGAVTSDDLTAAVDKVVAYLRNSLVQEALVSTGLLLVFVIVVLLGLLRAAAGMLAPAPTRAEGGQRFYAAQYDGDDHAAAAAAAHDPPPFFPRFTAGADTAAADDAAAARLRDEKLSTAAAAADAGLSSSSAGRKPVLYEKRGHWRASSYGEVDDAGR